MISLKELRKERGLSQERLALRAGVSSQTLWRMEHGKAMLPVVVEAVARALSADPDEIEVKVANRVK